MADDLSEEMKDLMRAEIAKLNADDASFTDYAKSQQERIQAVMKSMTERPMPNLPSLEVQAIVSTLQANPWLVKGVTTYCQNALAKMQAAQEAILNGG